MHHASRRLINRVYSREVLVSRDTGSFSVSVLLVMSFIGRDQDVVSIDLQRPVILLQGRMW